MEDMHLKRYMKEGLHYKAYPIKPQPKPRMTKRDTWKQRPCVVRYRAFKDEVRKWGLDLPEEGAHVIFVIPMPKSWSKKKKEEYAYYPHTQKPDIDNLTKALLDSIFSEDEHIWDIHTAKIWGEEPFIIIGK